MKNKAKALTLFLFLDIILYLLFSLQNKSFFYIYWSELDLLNFTGYIVFSLVLSFFYYLVKLDI